MMLMTYLYAWVKKGTKRVKVSVLLKNATQCPRAELKPGPLDPETSAIAMRPPRLPRNELILTIKVKSGQHPRSSALLPNHSTNVPAQSGHGKSVLNSWFGRAKYFQTPFSQ